MFWRIFAINETLVVIQFILAWRGSMATTAQMNSLGYTRGVPALCHGGWWVDFLLLGWVMATIMHNYSYQWSRGAIAGAFTFSTILTVWANLSYLQMSKEVPNFTAVAGWLTKAGMVHLVYSIFVFAICLLFWFGTQRVADYSHVVLIALATLVHIYFGFMQPAHHVGDPLTKPGLLGPIVLLLLLLAAGVCRLSWIVPRL